jgi:hypothetical protein
MPVFVKDLRHLLFFLYIDRFGEVFGNNIVVGKIHYNKEGENKQS